MRHSQVDPIIQRICDEIENQMTWTGDEGYIPDWADSIVQTVMNEFRGYIGDAVYNGMSSWERSADNKKTQEIKELKLTIKELTERLKSYALIDKAYQEAHASRAS